MTDPVIPVSDRTVAPTEQYPGMTQIVRDGRCYQVRGAGPESLELLEHHARCVANGGPLPDYGRRWPEMEGSNVE